jgi:hypothetical protein
MFVYNITIKVSWDIADEWLDWQREKNIPEIMATNLFDDHRIFRILEQEDQDGPTFTIQFFTTDQERYDQYINEFAPTLSKKSFEKWADQFVEHQTCMRLVN